MMPRMRKWSIGLVLTVVASVFALAACAPVDDKSSSAPGSGDCEKASLPTLKPGVLTFGTDQPAYPPWFVDNQPSNGKGFESAVAYAVGAKLGFKPDDVQWVSVPFNAAIAPGPKTYDADLNQFSITEERKNAVDFSSPYYDVTQAVLALKASPAAKATTVEQVRKLKLGAQVGTTSYTAAAALGSSEPVAVYNNNDDPRQRYKTVRSMRWSSTLLPRSRWRVNFRTASSSGSCRPVATSQNSSASFSTRAANSRRVSLERLMRCVPTDRWASFSSSGLSREPTRRCSNDHAGNRTRGLSTITSAQIDAGCPGVHCSICGRGGAGHDIVTGMATGS